MLKSNSKKAKENIRLYILKNFDPEYIEEENQAEADALELSLENFKKIAQYIVIDFKRAKQYELKRYNYRPIFEVFTDWMQGLPGIIDSCYYYNRSAVEDVKNILEETEAEASRYTEEEAEKLLTHLIFRELNAAYSIF